MGFIFMSLSPNRMRLRGLTAGPGGASPDDFPVFHRPYRPLRSGLRGCFRWGKPGSRTAWLHANNFSFSRTYVIVKTVSPVQVFPGGVPKKLAVLVQHHPVSPQPESAFAADHAAHTTAPGIVWH